MTLPLALEERDTALGSPGTVLRLSDICLFSVVSGMAVFSDYMLAIYLSIYLCIYVFILCLFIYLFIIYIYLFYIFIYLFI